MLLPNSRKSGKCVFSWVPICSAKIGSSFIKGRSIWLLGTISTFVAQSFPQKFCLCLFLPSWDGKATEKPFLPLWWELICRSGLVYVAHPSSHDCIFWTALNIVLSDQGLCGSQTEAVGSVGRLILWRSSSHGVQAGRCWSPYQHHTVFPHQPPSHAW